MKCDVQIAAKSDLSEISEAAWQRARSRMTAIAPLLEGKPTREAVRQQARQIGCHTTTLYRWLRLWRNGETLSSLVALRPGSAPGASRLDVGTEAVLQAQLCAPRGRLPKQSVGRVLRRIAADCRTAGLVAPHAATVRRRRQARELQTKARPLYGSFPGANGPLAVVQIDHTKLDLTVVDEQERTPLGRPWLTLAIDVYSRVIAGFYLSLDSPGVHSVGLCLVQAILPKEPLLAGENIEHPWPVTGLMDAVHADNGRDFRSHTLGRAAEEWGIALRWRPVREPWYGGHIERLIGTIAQELHQLPGTTFSSPDKRGSYDSAQTASLTLKELNRWLLLWITGVYHCRVHRMLGVTPLVKYREGVRASRLEPRPVSDASKLALDFMPLYERSVSRAGIAIEGIHYWSDVLRPWVEARDPKNSGRKCKFTVRRDPRDISAVWFWDHEASAYQRIPYRNLSHPAVSVWELRNALRRARQERTESRGGSIGEQQVFAAYDRLRVEEAAAVRKTRAARRNSGRRPAADTAYAEESAFPLLSKALPVGAFNEIEDF